MTQLLQSLADRFKAAPVLLALMLLNFAIFGLVVYVLHSVNEDQIRRDELLKECLQRR